MVFQQEIETVAPGACDFGDVEKILCEAQLALGNLPNLLITLQNAGDPQSQHTFDVPYYSLVNKSKVLLDIGIAYQEEEFVEVRGHLIPIEPMQ
jgi:hypothetical protein